MSIVIPRFPAPRKDGLKRALLKYHTDEGICVCLGDGSESATFPYVAFEMSPDGSSIAALQWIADAPERSESEEPRLITRLDLIGTRSEATATLVTPEVEIIEMAWSPGSERIWFATGGSSPRFTYNIHIGSGEITCIAPGVSPKPSPDGRFVAFFGLEPLGVHLLNTESNCVRFLTSGHPHAWSPDSRYLAYLDVSGSAWQLYVYDAFTEECSHVAKASPFSYWPTWLPNSSQIAFELSPSGAAGGRSFICQVEVHGEELEEITHGPRDHQPSIHPQLGYLAYHSSDPNVSHECQVWVIDPESGKPYAIGAGRQVSWLLVE